MGVKSTSTTKVLLLALFLGAVSGLCSILAWTGPDTIRPASSANPHHSRSENSVNKRIVCIGPNVTETLFALGRGDRVVGVSDFCNYPPEALGVAKVGAFINPNLEKITALRPDLVVVQGMQEKMDRFCKSRGIPILHVHMNTLSSIYSGILNLGRKFDAIKRAYELCEEIQAQIERISKEVAPYPPRKVFICLGRADGGLTNLFTAGGSSYISEILEVAGGENIFGDLKHPYPEVSKESLIKRGPEVILEMRPGESIPDFRQSRILGDWQILQGIPAISTGAIHILTEDFILVPGPRVGMATRFLARTLHPEPRHES